MFLYQLADRFGEPDIRKIADLPAPILRHWEAYFSLVDTPPEEASDPSSSPTPPAFVPVDEDNLSAQCAAVMRALM